MTRTGGSHPEAGFTLIELLVSLTIMSVMIGLLVGALRVVSKNWDEHAAQIDRLDMISRAADILNRDAASLHRVVSALDEQSLHYVFRGQPRQLSFVTLEPPYPTEAGPYFVDYSIVAEGQSSVLVRARAQYQPDMLAFPGATPANRVSLLEGAFQYRFTYGARGKGKLVWYDTWPFAKRLPDLIRLEVVDGRSNAAAAPPIVVAVRADAETSCLASDPGPCSAGGDGELKASSSRQEKKKKEDEKQSPTLAEASHGR
jgi:general secretion pathway protein J